MVRKKVEGDEDQRRRAAHKAHRDEESPSVRHATTGASKQRAHRSAGDSSRQDEETPVQRQGKQGHSAEAPDAAPPSAARPARPESPFQGRGHPDYSAEHEQVFAALVTAEQRNGGQPVLLADIARSADRSEEETRVLVHDLVAVHHLVTELQGSDPVEDPRYETKLRL
ncbi:hypothetical protein OIE63_35250 [Streptomyces sp. NBC_01795]|uniref:hypothetical protein n=1 Tax=unclassified Streptomyces TaxID=2593676 RepID=UPI002DD94D98|nr:MULTISPECIES: hypothetical protein [unclassified Streptomyces]WSA96235.1 hypothetical protein OIE63_35250 [Streptomyces sp. NBC_01795]WSB80648.1 hypothetical protein OHB04_36355 [Streptomyces sp. NBC_01775]WSS11142.1 hypothetical protein OG533_03895 [Streptomyces sp. NBC_01186]